MKGVMMLFLIGGFLMQATTGDLLQRTEHDDWIIFTKNGHQIYAAHQVGADIYYAYDSEEDEVCFGSSAQKIWKRLERYFSTSEVIIAVEAGESPSYVVCR